MSTMERAVWSIIFLYLSLCSSHFNCSSHFPSIIFLVILLLIKSVLTKCSEDHYNPSLSILSHISYKDHITNEIVCNKIQAAIGQYLRIYNFNNCAKKEATMVRTRDQIKWPLQKDHTRNSSLPGKRKKEEGKIKDGKTTSESGPVSISTAVREQPRTVRYGRRLSPMSAVAPLRP